MKKKTLNWSMLLVLALIWGSSFVLMKWGMKWEGQYTFKSDEVAALRIVLASAFLLPLLIKHYKIDLKKYFLPLLGMGMFGNLIPAFLFTSAETQISSSMAGMLNALTPLFTMLIAVFVLGYKTNLFQISGILIGFFGAILLVFFNQGNASQTDSLFFCSLIVAATLCYAISVNIIKTYLSELNSITAATWAFTFIGPFALAYLVFNTNFTVTLKESQFALNSLGAIAILGIVGSAISVIAFNTLIKNSGTVFASTVTYLIPVVAVIWGIKEGETIVWQQFAGMAVILGAIYLINFKKKEVKT